MFKIYMVTVTDFMISVTLHAVVQVNNKTKSTIGMIMLGAKIEELNLFQICAIC
jgi:hypothetical protein